MLSVYYVRLPTRSHLPLIYFRVNKISINRELGSISSLYSFLRNFLYGDYVFMLFSNMWWYSMWSKLGLGHNITLRCFAMWFNTLCAKSQVESGFLKIRDGCMFSPIKKSYPIPKLNVYTVKKEIYDERRSSQNHIVYFVSHIASRRMLLGY